MQSKFNIAKTLDTCGTRCPVPLLRAKVALKQLQAGEFLQVLATDPGAKVDFDAMLRHLPHELVEYVSTQPDNGAYARIDSFVIEKR